jgi:uroporphyrinogen-III synthase
MAILVTRPQPDNDATAAALRALGHDVLAAPMLRFERVMLTLDAHTQPDAVIVTSANALRALAEQPALPDLLRLPLFAVGDRTAQAAQDAGFAQVMSAQGDAGALRDALVKRAKKHGLKAGATLLYLAGADLARDLAGDLGAHGFHVVTQTTYRMAPVTFLPDDVVTAFAAGTIDAVLHYSRRSARAFFQAAGHDGVEISALALPHGCLSEAVAAVARDAGATQVIAAAAPDEASLFSALARVVAVSR